MSFLELQSQKEKEVFPGFRGKAIHTGNMTIIYWEVEAGAVVPMHQHLHEQVAQVTEGTFELTIGDETQSLTPGKIGVIPSNTIHGGKAITFCRLSDVFYPEREDYKF